MNNNNKNYLGWSITNWQFHNLVPIIVTFMTLALTYGALLTRISVLETKIDRLLIDQQQVLAKFHDVETRYGELALRVERLDTLISKK